MACWLTRPIRPLLDLYSTYTRPIPDLYPTYTRPMPDLYSTYTRSMLDLFYAIQHYARKLREESLTMLGHCVISIWTFSVWHLCLCHNTKLLTYKWSAILRSLYSFFNTAVYVWQCYVVSVYLVTRFHVLTCRPFHGADSRVTCPFVTVLPACIKILPWLWFLIRAFGQPWPMENTMRSVDELWRSKN